MRRSSHEFALYCKTVPDVQAGASWVIDDPLLSKRMIRVLRVTSGDTLVMFNRAQHVRVRVTDVQKKQCTVEILAHHNNTTLIPRITVYLPLLKRAALEDAMYSLVECGATEIRLFTCDKTQQRWHGQKEYDRLHTIMIAAAEQSKQFAVPQLYEPIPFNEVVQRSDVMTVFADPEGTPLFDVATNLRDNTPQELSLLVGPEGDLTDGEKELLKKHKVLFCKLTPTVLRAQQALTLLLGSLRSLL